MLHSYNVRNIKVRLTECLSSNYSAVQLVPARPRGIVFGRTHSERERVSAGQKCCLAAFYNETRHLQDVQAITAERT